MATEKRVHFTENCEWYNTINGLDDIIHEVSSAQWYAVIADEARYWAIICDS